MAIGQGYGNRKTHQAIDQALNHPLLGDVNLENAAGIIANITCGEDLACLKLMMPYEIYKQRRVRIRKLCWV